MDCTNSTCVDELYQVVPIGPNAEGMIPLCSEANLLRIAHS